MKKKSKSCINNYESYSVFFFVITFVHVPWVQTFFKVNKIMVANYILFFKKNELTWKIKTSFNSIRKNNINENYISDQSGTSKNLDFFL